MSLKHGLLTMWQRLVELDACTDKTCMLSTWRRNNVERGRFTVVLVIREVVIQHQVLDALLLRPLDLLLVA